LAPGTAENLERILDRARRERPSYKDVGATRTGRCPVGFRPDRHRLTLDGPFAFERAKDGLTRWQAHVGAGAAVFPGHPIEDGDTVLVVLGLGPVQVVAPCRIIYIVDEPHRFGLAYGTLPGHPESGEESFVVERDRNGSTVFVITAFSRPAHWATKLAAPLTRGFQLKVTRRYLDALARFVAQDGVSGTGPTP
jgi:uncharacterized protein (UPF0548 family)